jgi:hypothetical protein
MIRHSSTIGAVIAVFVLSQAPAFGQAGSRPNTTGSSTGSASPRGGEGGSGSGSSSAGTASSAGPSSGAATPSRSGGAAAPRERAPQRPVAVPRSASSAGDSTESRPAGTRVNPGDAGSNAVPTYSRPRDGRTPLGSATDRRDAPPSPGTNIIYYPYNPYTYYDWRYGSRFGSGLGYGLGYGFGYGHFGYDPFLFGPGYYGAPSYSAGGYSTQQSGGTGNLRLRVRPSEAQVYVDGYYVGTVNEFNGIFQRLNIDSGPHRIELRAEGYETVEFEVFVTPGETITYRGEMKPLIR